MAFGDNKASFNGIPAYFVQGTIIDPEDAFYSDYVRYSGAILPNLIGDPISVTDDIVLPEHFYLDDVKAKRLTSRDFIGGENELEPVQLQAHTKSWSYCGNYVLYKLDVKKTQRLDRMYNGTWSRTVDLALLDALACATDQQVISAFVGKAPKEKSISMYDDIAIGLGQTDYKADLQALPLKRYIPIDWAVDKDDKAPAGDTLAGQQLTEAKIRAVSRSLGATGASGQKILVVPASLMPTLTHDSRAWDKNNAMFIQDVIHRTQQIMVHDVLVVGVPDNHFPGILDSKQDCWYETNTAHMYGDGNGADGLTYRNLPMYNTNNPNQLRVTYAYGFIRNKAIKWAEYVDVLSSGSAQDEALGRAPAPGLRVAPYIEPGRLGMSFELLYKNQYGWARIHDENIVVVELNAGSYPATHA